MDDMEEMSKNAEAASNFLKSIASQHRLAVLCVLIGGEKTVGELTEMVGISQSSMSQHLARLRDEGIVDYRRNHRYLYYYISNPHVSRIIEVLKDMFCSGKSC